MHDIIKKALDEALTEKYHAELMGCAETDYAFSVGFLADMKALIRKTDNKLIYYSKYIAAAACAVVAIGCAVLIPNLINSGIDVKPPVTEITTSAVTGPEVTTVTTTPESDSGTVPAVTSKDTTTTEITTTPDETTTSEEATDTEITTAPEETTTTVTTTEDYTPETDVEEDEAVDAEADTGDDADEIIDGDIIAEDGEDDTVADEEETEVEGDIIADEEDDAAAEEDDDVVTDAEDNANPATGPDNYDTDEEDDVVIEDSAEEDDADIEEDADDDVVIEDETDEGDDAMPIIPTLPQGATLEEICENVFVGYQFEDLKFAGFNGMGDYNFKPDIVDYTFIEEFIQKHASAEPLAHGGNYGLTDSNFMFAVFMAPNYVRPDKAMYDRSRRNYYDSFFNPEEDDVVEDEDVMPDEEDDVTLVRISVYKNGYIKYQNQGSSDEAYFKADSAAMAELLAELDKIGLASGNTVGKVMSSIDISAANINKSYLTIYSYYDISISNVKLDTAGEKQAVVDLLNKYKNTKCTHEYPPISIVPSCGISLEIGFNSSHTPVYLIVDKNGAALYDFNNVYRFKMSEADQKSLISLACSSAGVAEPVFYETMADYVKGRTFDKLTEVYYVDWGESQVTHYTVTDKKKLAELYNMLAAEAETAEYAPFVSYRSGDSIDFSVGAWYIDLMEGDYFHLNYNRFKASDGFRDKVVEYMKTNADKVSTYEFEADEEVTDDVEIEDEIDE